MKYIYGRKQPLDRLPVPCGFRELEVNKGGIYKRLLLYSRELSETERRECCLELVTTVGR